MQKRKKSMKGRNIFTIIELLIVVAVIAIFVGMLLPVLSKTRDKARTIDCINRVKQTTYVIFLYGDDYHGFRLSIQNINPNTGSATGSWIQTLMDCKYIPTYKNNQTIPQEAFIMCNSTPWQKFWSANNTFGIMTNGPYNGTSTPGYLTTDHLKINASKRPSNDILVGDSVRDSDWRQTMQMSPIGRNDNYLHFRHSGDTGNYGCYDGHVANLVPDKVKFMDNFVNYSSSNPSNSKKVIVGATKRTIYSMEL